MAGLVIYQLTGKQRALLDLVTITNAKQNPILALLPKGGTVTNVHFEWPLDLEEEPKENAVPDGKDEDNFQNAEENYMVVSNRCQYARRAYKVGNLAQEEPVAGIKNHTAYARKKAIDALWADIEATLGSDQEVTVGNATIPDKTRAIGTWISNSISTPGYTVPSEFLPSTTAIYTGAINSLSSDIINNMCQAVWEKGGVSANQILQMVTGPMTKNRFRKFQQTESGPVISTIRVYSADLANRTLFETVDRFVGDWGTVELIPTLRNAHPNLPGGSPAANQRRAYLLNPSKWQIIWRMAPRIKPLPDLGGGPRFLAEAWFGLRCLKPDANAAIKSTT